MRRRTHRLPLVFGVSLALPCFVVGCGDGGAGQGSGANPNPNYGKDAGGDSAFDAPENPDGEGPGEATADSALQPETAPDGPAIPACTSTAECDDGNPCTHDACDPQLGCVHDPAPMNGQLCSDGNACTSPDTCTAGSCTGTAASCDDGNPCTVDSCASGTGCVHDSGPLEDTQCDDGDACTQYDTCTQGACNGVLVDADADGVGASCDNCPDDHNPLQEDSEGVRAMVIPFAPVAMSGATPVSFQSSSVLVPIGFDFTFFGTTYDELLVYRDGVLTFGGPLICEYGAPMPCASGDYGVADLISLVWSYMEPGLGGTVSYMTTGTAPNRRFVVDFDKVPMDAGGNGPLFTAQAILYETTNRVEIHTTSQLTEFWSASTRGVAHNDDTSPLAAYLPEDYNSYVSLSDSAAAYTTGSTPDGIGDACANRSAEVASGCDLVCGSGT